MKRSTRWNLRHQFLRFHLVLLLLKNPAVKAGSDSLKRSVGGKEDLGTFLGDGRINAHADDRFGDFLCGNDTRRLRKFVPIRNKGIEHSIRMKTRIRGKRGDEFVESPFPALGVGEHTHLRVIGTRSEHRARLPHELLAHHALYQRRRLVFGKRRRNDLSVTHHGSFWGIASLLIIVPDVKLSSATPLTIFRRRLPRTSRR